MFGLPQKSVGASQILDMFTNISQPLRGVFGCSEKLLWPTKYYNLNWLATDQSVQWKDQRHSSATGLIILHQSIFLDRYLFDGRLMPLVGMIHWLVNPALKEPIPRADETLKKAMK